MKLIWNGEICLFTWTESSRELRQPKSRSNAICCLAMAMRKFLLFDSLSAIAIAIVFDGKLKFNRFTESENCVENDCNFLLFFSSHFPDPDVQRRTQQQHIRAIASRTAEIRQHMENSFSPTVGRMKWICSNFIRNFQLFLNFFFERK